MLTVRVALDVLMGVCGLIWGAGVVLLAQSIKH